MLENIQMIARNHYDVEIFDEFQYLHRISILHNLGHFSISIRTWNDVFHWDDIEIHVRHHDLLY